MFIRIRLGALLTLAAVGITTLVLTPAQAAPIDTGPITLTDFFGAGEDLNAEIVDGHSIFNASGTWDAANAFDSNTGTEWATAGGTGVIPQFLDLNLTGAPAGGVTIDGFMWDNRGSVDVVNEIDVTFYSDLFTTPVGSTGPLGLTVGPDNFSIGPFDSVQSVRFSSTGGNAANPGAQEIQLFGSLPAAVPEPASVAIWLFCGVGLMGYGWCRRRRKVQS